MQQGRSNTQPLIPDWYNGVSFYTPSHWSSRPMPPSESSGTQIIEDVNPLADSAIVVNPANFYYKPSEQLYQGSAMSAYKLFDPSKYSIQIVKRAGI